MAILRSLVLGVSLAGLLLGGGDASAQYVFETKLTPAIPDPDLGSGFGSGFGAAVGVGSTSERPPRPQIFVGIPHSGGPRLNGRASVFLRNPDGSWGLEDVIQTGSDGARFGEAIAAEGRRVNVGAPYADDEVHGLSASGEVHTMFIDAGVRAFGLVFPDPAEGSSRFGTSLALSGGTDAFGAPESGPLGQRFGSVYVVGPGPLTRITAAVPTVNGDFGRTIALSGSRLVVGARRHDDNRGEQTNPVFFVYDRAASGAWIETARLFLPPGYAGPAQFGSPLGVVGDVVVVGDSDDAVAGGSAGAVHPFVRQPNGQWLRLEALRPGDVQASLRFGFSVAFVGDTLVVGAQGDLSSSGPEPGAYVYRHMGGGRFVELQKLVSPDPDPQETFGYSLDLEDSTIAVGAPYRIGASGAVSGAVYVYSMPSLPAVNQMVNRCTDFAGDFPQSILGPSAKQRVNCFLHRLPGPPSAARTVLGLLGGLPPLPQAPPFIGEIVKPPDLGRILPAVTLPRTDVPAAQLR